jgi:hypothetical protein
LLIVSLPVSLIPYFDSDGFGIGCSNLQWFAWTPGHCELRDSTSNIVPLNLNKTFFIETNLCSDREKILEIINPDIVKVCAAGKGKEVKSAAGKGK